MGSPTLSEKSVIVRGPEQSVSKVAKAVVSADIDNELTETTTLTGLKVTLLDADDKEIEDDSMVIEPITVDVTIPVLMKKTVPIVLEYENSPDVFDPTGFITLDPYEIEIAASSDVLDSINSISVGTLNFNELSYGTSSMTFDIVMPEGVKNFNNIKEVTFDAAQKVLSWKLKRGEAVLSVSLYNQQGECVYTGNGRRGRVDMRRRPSGSYIVRIETLSRVIRCRFFMNNSDNSYRF